MTAPPYQHSYTVSKIIHRVKNKMAAFFLPKLLTNFRHIYLARLFSDEAC